MRRQIGIAGIQKNKLVQEKFKEQGVEVLHQQFELLKDRLEFFKTNLQEFALKHKNEINKNPELRHYFSQMCSKIGVDPLASKKGFWAELLGVGDFYYELAIQIIEVCFKTRNQNGGIIKLDELYHRLATIAKYQNISHDDIKQAIKNIQNGLGQGYQIMKIGNSNFVQSVPCELNSDNTLLLNKIQEEQERRSVNYMGWTLQALMNLLHWSEQRVNTAMEVLLLEGMVWIDQVNSQSPIEYYFVCLL